MKMQMHECVKNGIALMDSVVEQLVPNWRSKIDKKKLSIRGSRTCVLGMVFDCEYIDAWAKLVAMGITQPSYYYGFVPQEFSSENWKALTKEWEKQL